MTKRFENYKTKHASAGNSGKTQTHVLSGDTGTLMDALIDAFMQEDGFALMACIGLRPDGRLRMRMPDRIFKAMDARFLARFKTALHQIAENFGKPHEG